MIDEQPTLTVLYCLPDTRTVAEMHVRPLRFAVSRSNGGPSLLDGARIFAAALQKRSGLPVTVSIAYDYAALLKSLLGGSAELAWMPPLIHGRAVAAGAKLVALAQRGGVLGYHSAILVRSDNPCARLGDLSSVRAAWVDKASSSGYLFPRLHLLSARGDPQTVFASERFYGSATASCRAVMHNEADLCACFLSRAREQNAAQREVDETFNTGGVLRVLDVTAQIPPDGFVVANSLDAAQTAALRSTLLSLHQFADGREALQELLQAEQLATAPEAVLRDLARLVASTT